MKINYLIVISTLILCCSNLSAQSILVSYGINSDLYSEKATSFPFIKKQENFIGWNFRIAYEHPHKLGAWFFTMDLSQQKAGKIYRQEQFEFGYTKMSHNNAFALQLSTYFLWKTNQQKKCILSVGPGFGFKLIPSRDIATLDESFFIISPVERYDIYYENRGLRNFSIPLLLQASFDYKFNDRLTFSASVHYQTGFWKNYITSTKIVHTNNLEVTEKYSSTFNRSAKWNILFGIKFTLKSKENNLKTNE